MSIRTYKTSESVIFRKTKEAFGGLSNMASGYSLKVNEIIIPTSEHLYQACRFPEHPQLQWDIIQEPSPMTAKWIAKANVKHTRLDWEQIQFKVMKWALEVKLSQNWNAFSKLLLETGDKYIVESTRTPKVWGAVQKGEVFEGVNALGRLLMEIRETYVKTNRRIECVQPLHVSNFKLLDFSIGLICYDSDLAFIDSKNELLLA